ncbi:hypothetical protein B1992_04125 [Pseudoxanthomonas broegbernensis]|uniref:Methyltransferase domain-containing protein n=1 Tax=Pseudoxanthomonas broegbernensis TaxID=83619 RepID=A0A7V8GNI8_9GAMM|nr:class I SAM-dependent methyltransferase [Pseudoxanthomonas broegbernensis]KAF1687183.1 hypothetical protein B1992_04125 [Pseudoxanthomonas broegbernensis]MBB6065836.1 2-polyprenyl-6-hydroxyphenyl methylase/3-demethylubiquinone-9 3-methyltransferase [Pseudoxanthomonas broegbernensis]
MNSPHLLSVESHFAFGKNWLDYARKIDEQKIAQAIVDLQRLSGRERFDGMSFLDIGCGSGLHSLAAARMGAVRVTGVDIDPDSIDASRATLARFAPLADARFDQASVFDMRAEEYRDFDLVYSWGVLHHTGDMYRALAVASSLVRPGGTFMVALYRKTPFCGMWRIIKRWYASAPPSSQERARKIRVALHRLAFRLRGRSHQEYIRNYGQCRGMDYYNDIHDWMGGYPYESISKVQCHAFFQQREFELEREFVAVPKRLSGLLGSGCDEYVFRRRTGPASATRNPTA